MMNARALLQRLRAAREGAVIVEVALLAPIVVMIGLGTVDASRIVARQAQLQSGISEGAQIVLAAAPDNDSKITAIKSVIASTTGLATSNVTITTVYRCGTDAAFVSLPGYCSVTGEISKYLQVIVTDNYKPYWTSFGIGKSINMKIRRNIQIS